jgi:molecular chaperone GrpE
LQNIGLVKIKTTGEQFDPSTMEAVSVEEGDGDEIVTAEIQAGYTYNGKVIRPALVKVTR